MKPILLALASLYLVLNTVFGQATSAKTITKKVAERDQQRQQANSSALGEAARTKPAPPPAAAAQPSVPAAKPAPPREKTKEEKDAIEKKTVEFQKQRATAGQASAQYDLGVRYLTGKGVEKNQEEARKWLELAAKQGNTMAERKLSELGKATK